MFSVIKGSCFFSFLWALHSGDGLCLNKAPVLPHTGRISPVLPHTGRILKLREMTVVGRC